MTVGNRKEQSALAPIRSERARKRQHVIRPVVRSSSHQEPESDNASNTKGCIWKSQSEQEQPTATGTIGTSDEVAPASHGDVGGLESSPPTTRWQNTDVTVKVAIIDAWVTVKKKVPCATSRQRLSWPPSDPITPRYGFQWRGPFCISSTVMTSLAEIHEPTFISSRGRLTDGSNTCSCPSTPCPSIHLQLRNFFSCILYTSTT